MRLAAALLASIALSWCGDEQERAVVDAARSMSALLAAGEASAACGLLAPASRQELAQTGGEPCATALPALDLVQIEAVSSVQRYGRQASVVVESSDGEQDTWFLSRFDGRWLLVAASCEPRGELPYDCDLEGP